MTVRHHHHVPRVVRINVHNHKTRRSTTNYVTIIVTLFGGEIAKNTSLVFRSGDVTHTPSCEEVIHEEPPVLPSAINHSAVQ
jgi:hypothetical protein